MGPGEQMPSEHPIKITRQALSDGTVAKLAAAREDAQTYVASEDELLASRRQLLADDADCSDIWVFGYGSLIFNPVFEHIDKCEARIYGRHRRFCLWTRIGRGTPERPGLVLGLDQGGSCTGLAFRLDPGNAIDELDLLWRREMISMSYQARWVTLHTADGIKRAITFVLVPDRPNYAARMPIETEAEIIASASGFIGHCRDYLFDTVDGLHQYGLRDPYLEKLAGLVKARLAL